MSQPSESFLTLGEVAARTGRHPELLRQWCAAGRIPARRVGGCWVIREEDIGLLDRMATRSRRRAPVPVWSGRRRLLAAMFPDAERVAAATSALQRRLHVEEGAIQAAPLSVGRFGDLGLTILAGEVPEESLLDARRILSAFGGRIVAELDPVGSRSAPRSARHLHVAAADDAASGATA